MASVSVEFEGGDSRLLTELSETTILFAVFTQMMAQVSLF